MTYSILGHDRSTGALGVAVQSKFPGVGSLVPYGRAGVGVVATQAFGNPMHGTVGLDLLRCGAQPEQAIEILLQGDPQRNQRQVGIMNAQGRCSVIPEPISTAGRGSPVSRGETPALLSATGYGPRPCCGPWLKRTW